MQDNLKNTAVSGVLWSFVEQISTKFIQFAISIILARLLIPSDYGLIGMLAFFMAIAGVFIDGGFSTALIQLKDRSDKDYNTVFYINIAMSILCYFILFFTAPLISDFYNQTLLIPIIRVYSISLILGSLVGINTTILTINIDYKTKSKISVICAVLSGISGIIMAYLGYGVWALVFQSLISGLLSVVLHFYYVRWFPKLIFSKESFKKLFGFGSKLLCSSIIASAYSNIYSLVIGKIFKPAILGYYSRAQGFITLTASNLNSIISRVAFPILCKVQDDEESLLNIYKKYIQMSAFIIFPIILFLCGIAKPLILFLLTDKWSFAIFLLQILCFSYMWDGIIDINLSLLKAKGRSDLVLKLEIIKKTIAFSILIITAFTRNIYTICYGSVIYSLIALYLNTYYSKRLLNLSLIKQLKLIYPYLFLSCVVLLVSLLISHYISNSLISLILSVIVCPTIYLLAAKYWNLYAYSQFITIVSPFVAKFKLQK